MDQLVIKEKVDLMEIVYKVWLNKLQLPQQRAKEK